MSGFNNNPVSYWTGSQRLVNPDDTSLPYFTGADDGAQCQASVAPDATSFNTGGNGGQNGFYFYESPGAQNPGTAPSAPTPPIVAGTPTGTTITVTTNAGFTGGKPAPQISFLYGTSNPPQKPFPAQVAFGSLYTGTVTDLIPNTTYYIASVASNPSGRAVSAATQTSTTSGQGTAPSPAPSVPILVSKTSTSITVSYNATTTGFPVPSFGVFVGKTTTPTVFVSASAAGSVYTATATGLTAGTTYYFQAVAQNGVPPNAVSAVSAGFTTSPTPPTSNLKTNLVVPFLIQGPRFNTPYPNALDYYINVDAVGCVLPIGGTSIVGLQKYGYMYGGSKTAPGVASNAGLCTSDQPASTAYGQVTASYLNPLQSAGCRLLTSWGGFYADILGLFGPYQPAGYPGTNPALTDVIKSFLYNYCGVTSATNPLNWSNQGYTTRFDGLVLDFENVGYGGNPNTTNQYPLPQSTLPVFPAAATSPTYAPYVSFGKTLVLTMYNLAPNVYLANAPVSLSINGDALNGARNGNVSAPNTALNTWFAFANSTTVPSAATYNNDISHNALNHHVNMSFMDDVFVQFYNEDPDNYLGGKNFANILAQWGYVALLAQSIGRKTPRINIGLARGTIIPGGSPAIASAQGPTPPLGNQTGPPYTYWYPQYATSSPPNSTSTSQNPQAWPNTSPTLDPVNLANAITQANTILQVAYNNPTLAPSAWCSGVGFWGAGQATLAAKAAYTKGDPLSPGAVLPALQTYCWAEASYPAPDPLWPGNTPIQSTLKK